MGLTAFGSSSCQSGLEIRKGCRCAFFQCTNPSRYSSWAVLWIILAYADPNNLQCLIYAQQSWVWPMPHLHLVSWPEQKSPSGDDMISGLGNNQQKSLSRKIDSLENQPRHRLPHPHCKVLATSTAVNISPGVNFSCGPMQESVLSIAKSPSIRDLLSCRGTPLPPAHTWSKTLLHCMVLLRAQQITLPSPLI